MDGLTADRDQLFAEAVDLYHRGEPWWPDRDFELAHIAPQQEARYETDAWQDMIETYLARQTQVTGGQVAKEALLSETAKIGTADQRRISAIMERMGWKRQPVDWQGKRWWSP